MTAEMYLNIQEEPMQYNYWDLLSVALSASISVFIIKKAIMNIFSSLHYEVRNIFLWELQQRVVAWQSQSESHAIETQAITSFVL